MKRITLLLVALIYFCIFELIGFVGLDKEVDWL